MEQKQDSGIQDKNYDNNTSGFNSMKKFYVKPLFIGCSGGGGHNTAITGIINHLLRHYTELNMNCIVTSYSPVLFNDKLKEPSSARDEIDFGLKIMHEAFGSDLIRKIVQKTAFPVLPDRKSLDAEIQKLNDLEVKKSNSRFIDMLLYVYQAGYASAAIWNVLQVKDETATLKKLIELQAESDRKNYLDVYNYFFNLLIKAVKEGTPYTEIISTQAMALPALCDAIKDYNEWLIRYNQFLIQNYDESIVIYPPVIIHQYMTDLPTEGAVHFFNALSTLKPEQQKQMKLYGVGMTESILQHFFSQKGKTYFAGLYDIPKQNNPMIRTGFIDHNNDNSNKFDQPIDINLQIMQKQADKYVATAGKNPIRVGSNEKIAAIMLGSQGSNDAVKYIKTLLENGMDKVFVFGASNVSIQQGIDDILKSHPDYQDRIIPLANQDDPEITQIMTRSNVLIIRGGGLTVMEQMAMPHNSDKQSIFIHHADSDKKELTSGISWEDYNVDSLLRHFEEEKIFAKKTSPQRMQQDLEKVQWNSILDMLQKNNDHQFYEFINHFNSLDENHKQLVMKTFSKLDTKLKSLYYAELYLLTLYEFLKVYFNQCYSNAEMSQKWLGSLDYFLNKDKLAKAPVDKFLNPNGYESFFNTLYLKSILTEVDDYSRQLNIKFGESSKVSKLVIGISNRFLDAVAQHSLTTCKQILQDAVVRLNKVDKHLANLFGILNKQILFEYDIIQLDQIISQSKLLFDKELSELSKDWIDIAKHNIVELDIVERDLTNFSGKQFFIERKNKYAVADTNLLTIFLNDFERQLQAYQTSHDTLQKTHPKKHPVKTSQSSFFINKNSNDNKKCNNYDEVEELVKDLLKTVSNAKITIANLKNDVERSQFMVFIKALQTAQEKVSQILPKKSNLANLLQQHINYLECKYPLTYAESKKAHDQTNLSQTSYIY